ncbi:Ribosomal RNA large subunit methyltransferase L [bioreactor metagenome]|uniref:Ribosomal RNA large subunit methyltransferase L n=1 Tax=bioreactor metagenome TaxID=1076179 RepID=A0A644WW09_9ZZZZ
MPTELFNYTFKTLAGLEPLLEKELLDAGCSDLVAVKRGFTFQADESMMYKLNYTSRFGIRLLVEVLRFSFETREDFITNIRSFEWDTYVGADKTIAVDAIVTASPIFNNSHFVELLTKDGVADFFRNRCGLRPSVDKENPDLLINIYVNNDECIVSVDSSGKSLHKRGYRVASHVAPLNEVLAAGIIGLSGWKMDCDFIDPMCGSGTILIEAAMMASNVPAGYYRSDFGFMHWQTYKPAMFERIRKEANAETSEFDFRIIGADRSEESLNAAWSNIRKARFDKDIELFKHNFFEISPDRPAHIVFNPPYDARLPIENSKEYYKKIGDTIKNQLQGSKVWMIVGNEELWKSIGLKATIKIPLLNGMIDSRLLCFEAYSGSKRTEPSKNSANPDGEEE